MTTETVENVSTESGGSALAARLPSIGNGVAAFDDMRFKAERMTASIEATLSKASEGVTALNIQAVDALRENVNSTFELWEKMIGARTLMQVIELQTNHTRERFETLSAQGQGLSTLAQRVAQDSLAPMGGLSWASAGLSR